MERDAIDWLLYIGVQAIPNLATALSLPWMQDGISEVERDALEWLYWIGRYDSDNLAQTLSLPWMQDGISEVERDALERLYGIGRYDADNLAQTLSLPWMQDGISEVERDLRLLYWIGFYDADNLAQTLSLPWMQDGISEVERDALERLYGIGRYDADNLAQTLSLPWMQDGISEVERDALRLLYWIGFYDADNLAQTLSLPWMQDGISEVERDALERLYGIGRYDADNLAQTLSLPWMQDGISEVEYDVVDWIERISHLDGKVAAALIPMPFLHRPDATDVLALRSIRTLAHREALAPLLAHPTFLDGITDAETTLVAAVGTLYRDAGEISRMLDPGNASIESFAITTDLTPLIFMNIIRAGSDPTRWVADVMADAAEFVERVMLLPLPIDHLILVLNDKAVTKNYAGTNYGFAFGFLPEYAQEQDTFEGRFFLRGIVHEVAHYYWGGRIESWIAEGLANTIAYMHGIEGGLSPGQLQAERRDCEAHDLEMVSGWDPLKGSLAYYCNYYLGERLFLELRDSMDGVAFSEKLRELYQLTLIEQGNRQTPGIDAVRQVFSAQGGIVEKHWSGGLNAPENRVSPP